MRRRQQPGLTAAQRRLVLPSPPPAGPPWSPASTASRCASSRRATGHQSSPCTEAVNSTDDVLKILLGLVDEVIGDQAFLVVGHSYGGYLARAIANRRPSQVAGLALICSAGGQADKGEVPEHVVLHASGELDGTVDSATDAEFRSHLVVQTPETLRRFQEYVMPGMGLVDQGALENKSARAALTGFAR